MSTIQDPRKTWLATGSLLTVCWKIPSLGPRLGQPLAFWLWLSPLASLPLAGEGPLCSWPALLWFLLNPLFSECARLCARAFCMKILSLSFFFFCLWWSLSLGCYLTLAPSDCLQDIQARSLPQGPMMQPMPPCPALLAGAGTGHLGYFSVGSCG